MHHSMNKCLVLLGERSDREDGLLAIQHIINSECDDGVFIYDPLTNDVSEFYNARNNVLAMLSVYENSPERTIFEILQEALVTDYLDIIRPKLLEDLWVITASWVDDFIATLPKRIQDAYADYGKDLFFSNIGNRYTIDMYRFSNDDVLEEDGKRYITAASTYKLVDCHGLVV